jgi:GH18 family chitinase
MSGEGTKIVLSIGRSFSADAVHHTKIPLQGGWGGSYWFSQATSNSANRKTLTDSLVGAINSFGLDGESTCLDF